MSKTSWDLDDGLKLVRALQEESTKFGYHVTLGGSVLHKGSSERDIDLFFFPANGETKASAREDLFDWLEKLWGRGRPLGYYDMGGGLFDEDRYRAPRVQVQFPPPVVRNLNDPMIPQVAQARAVDNNGFYVEPEDEPFDGAQPRQVFNHKLTFKRVGGDKIDVFIV